jgi:hypothetical protein
MENAVTNFAMRIGRAFFAAGLMAGMAGHAQAPAQAPTQVETVPTFGTTVVVPGGLVGVIYYISHFSKSLPYFQTLNPLGVIYTSSLNVPTRDFREGFPGVTDRFEWFAIDYSGRFWIEKPGQYNFELTSDDGSKLYIDDEVVVNNDGLHPAQTLTGAVTLAGGIHRIRVSYFQGPRLQVALVLRVAGPGEELRIFSTDEFKPPPDPASWTYLGQVFHLSPVTGAPGEEVSVEISLGASGTAPKALKWEVVFPAQVLELKGDGPETGGAATDSGKSLQCAPRNQYSYVCNLSGGPDPIASGPIAIFHFKVRNTAKEGAVTIRIERAVAVTENSKDLTLDDAEGTVTIQKR